jgi:anaerobic magnesium-protoporphyrin IX monomethyl ester cyclase
MRVLFISTYLAQEPLGVMHLSTALKAAGHETKMLFVPDPRLPIQLKRYDPDVVCYSLTTGAHTAVAGLNRIVKKIIPRAFAVAGGAHPSVVPEFLENESSFQALCRGEGEQAFVDLVDALATGGDLTCIPNIWYRDEHGVIHENAVRPLVNDLDSLGFCDRSLVYDASDVYRNSDRKVIKTDRGCPMNCSFCFHHAWKHKIYGVGNNEYVRRRSVSHVIEEALSIRDKYPMRFVHFLDDIFNINNGWLEEFAERWPKEVGLPFDAILMANMVTERHVRWLRQAGCVYARIAFEAADDHMRNAVMRKNTTRAQLVRAAELIRSQGIRLGSLNMLGGPGASLDDDMETVLLNIECKVDHPLASLLQPYPMTDINEMTAEMGVATDEWDSFPTLFNRTSSIANPRRHCYENLHKWFPILVRHPVLLPVARRTLEFRWLSRPFTWMYMLYSEWLVTEQNVLFRKAQGIHRWWRGGWLDFTTRVTRKGLMRMATVVAGSGASRLAARMNLNDERALNHLDS